ncbi:MAG: hypothetical protein V1787_02685 [Candidatus Micrarchaeota archaeon]
MQRKAVIAALVLAAIATAAGAGGPLGGLAKVFTEGNSNAKHAALLLAMAGFFAIGVLIPGKARAWLQARAGNLKKLWILSIAFGLAMGLVVQASVQLSLGGGPGSYYSLATDCGQSECWEATYFQHVHVMKSAVYWLEKTTGVFLPADADDGLPMYQLLDSPQVALAQTVAPAALVLIASAFLTTLAYALSEKELWKGALAALAGFIAVIAIADGGLFSLVGVVAVALAMASLSAGIKPGRLRQLAPIGIFALCVVLAFGPFWFLGTGLYFREWLTAPLFVCAAFFFSQNAGRRDAAFVVAVALLGVSTMLVLGDAGRYWLGETAHSEKMAVYGIPLDASDAEVALAAGSAPVARYGWYALFERRGPFNPAEEQQRMRAALKPRGYLLAEGAGIPAARQEATVHWLSLPVALEKTASYSDIAALELGGVTMLQGAGKLNGPQLALELGSYVRSRGGKAIVVTGVV